MVYLDGSVFNSFAQCKIVVLHIILEAVHSESEYLLSQYKFTRKFVLRCTVGDRINNRLIC